MSYFASLLSFDYRPNDRPTSAGVWWHYELVPVFFRKSRTMFVERTNPRRVLVTETPAGGRLCRELRMGGSMHCGLQPWSGEWRKPPIQL